MASENKQINLDEKLKELHKQQKQLNEKIKLVEEEKIKKYFLNHLKKVTNLFWYEKNSFLYLSEYKFWTKNKKQKDLKYIIHISKLKQYCHFEIYNSKKNQTYISIDINIYKNEKVFENWIIDIVKPIVELWESKY